MTRRSLAYFFKSTLKPFSMVFGAFSLNKQNMKEPWGSATCNCDVKGEPNKRNGHVYGPLKSEKGSDGWDSTILQRFVGYDRNNCNNRKNIRGYSLKGTSARIS